MPSGSITQKRTKMRMALAVSLLLEEDAEERRVVAPVLLCEFICDHIFYKYFVSRFQSSMNWVRVGFGWMRFVSLGLSISRVKLLRLMLF